MATIANRIELAPGNKIPGTRISVYEVYYWLVKGYDKAKTMEFLSITAEEYDLALAYIDVNRDDVERVHQEIEARNARGNPPELQAKLELASREGKLLRKWLATNGPRASTDRTNSPDRDNWLRTAAKIEFQNWLDAFPTLEAAESTFDDRPAA